MTDELGKMPESTTEEPELHPGGVDSIDDPKYGTTPDTPLAADARPEDNPAVPDAAPEEISELEDTDEAQPADDAPGEPTD